MNKLVTISIIAATASTVYAESLEERKFWKDQMDYVNRSLDEGEKQCGVKFSFEILDKPKLRAEAEKNHNSPFGVCTAIIDEVVSLCRAGDDEKASVKAKIKGFQCSWAKPRKLDLTNKGIIKWTGNLEESNLGDWAKAWLMKKL